MASDLWELKAGDKVRLDGGATAEVEAPTEDGAWVLIRYLDFPSDPGLVGTQDLCEADEITGKD